MRRRVCRHYNPFHLVFLDDRLPLDPAIYGIVQCNGDLETSIPLSLCRLTFKNTVCRDALDYVMFIDTLLLM